MRARLDQLGKNILRDFLVVLGSAETEAEVSAGDAQKIDLWYVPDPVRLRAHREVEPGLLQVITAEPGMIELFSEAIGVPAFHACLRKRYQWHHVLELRSKHEEELPRLWVVSAGRPEGVLEDFGFTAAKEGTEGHYRAPAPGWRVHIVVVAELPLTRSTVLLRLLGSPRARRQAIRDLMGLPAGAWEVGVALPWLGRLSFEVPAQSPELPADERDFIMETREWFEQLQRRTKEEGVEQGLARGRKQGQLQAVARLVEKRLRRPLADADRSVLAERLDRLGEDRIDDVILSSSAETLAAWLADPLAI